MAHSTARKLPNSAPIAFEQPDDDWQPLHPLHRRLVEEYSGAGAAFRHKPRFGARLAIIATLAVISWAVVVAIFQLFAAAF